MRMEQDPQTYAIIGAAMEVHRVLGPGFLEAVYRDALELEFRDRGIPYVREAALRIRYKEHELPSTYRADFLCYARVIVETKALRTTTTADDAQVIHYLKTTGLRVALLLNFGTTTLMPHRFAGDRIS